MAALGGTRTPADGTAGAALRPPPPWEQVPSPGTAGGRPPAPTTLGAGPSPRHCWGPPSSPDHPGSRSLAQALLVRLLVLVREGRGGGRIGVGRVNQDKIPVYVSPFRSSGDRWDGEVMRVMRARGAVEAAVGTVLTWHHTNAPRHSSLVMTAV